MFFWTVNTCHVDTIKCTLITDRELVFSTGLHEHDFGSTTVMNSLQSCILLYLMPEMCWVNEDKTKMLSESKTRCTVAGIPKYKSIRLRPEIVCERRSMMLAASIRWCCECAKPSERGLVQHAWRRKHSPTYDTGKRFHFGVPWKLSPWL